MKVFENGFHIKISIGGFFSKNDNNGKFSPKMIRPTFIENYEWEIGKVLLLGIFD